MSYENETRLDEMGKEMTEGENPILTLEEFLAEHPITDETEDVTLCERLKDFTFKIGLMTEKQRSNYLNICLIKDRKGKIVKQDMAKFNELVVLNHCIYPNFNSLDFVRKCDCSTPSEALYKVLKVGEVERLSQRIMEFNGFEDFDELRKKAKN